MHTSFSATNTATSFICYREKRKKENEGGKKEKNERKEGCRGKEGGLSFVRFVVFVRSVSCSVLYCAVALGATATRSIVIALPFSHHHQQAIAEIATERERERNASVYVCGSSTISNVTLVVSRVYADSRFFVVVVVTVVVVVVVILIEVNHECHQ